MPPTFSLSADDIEEEKSQIEGAKRQSENGRYSVNASIAGGSPPPPASLARGEPRTPSVTKRKE